jgi:N-methylhydantoinase A
MLSSGGLASIDIAAEQPASVIRSGPAAAVVATTVYAIAEHQSHALAFDMGGTSLDIGAIVDGNAVRVQSADFGGYRIARPMVDVVSVGSGGGSIAWLDAGGLLHVGPESAGARPGPACYGAGGERPTVTDADLVLGYANPAGFAGGRVAVDEDKAREAITKSVAEPLELSTEDAAAAIFDIVNLKMATSVGEFLNERGLDPRDFSLVVAGGAGPIHAAPVALELGIRKIIVPNESSILSAVGLLNADVRYDLVQTIVADLALLDLAHIRDVYTKLVENGRSALARQGITDSDQAFELSADIRYERQINEIEVPVDLGINDGNLVAAMATTFHREHHRAYGYAIPDVSLELVNLRVSALGRIPHVTAERGARARVRETMLLGTRSVTMGRGQPAREIPVYEAASLSSGQTLLGPMIAEAAASSLFVPPGWCLEVEQHRSLTLTVDTS